MTQLQRGMIEDSSKSTSEKQKAWALLRNNRLQEAKGLYARVCRDNPADAEAWHTLGVINGRLGLIDEAEAACRNAVAVDPCYAAAHCDLGNALFVKGRPEEALVCYREALRLNGGSAEAFNNLGTVLDALNRLDEAAESYRAALRLHPNAGTYCNLGNVLARQQKLEEAAAMYRECLARDPGNAVAQHRLISCTGEGVPERASDGYIRQTFDALAGKFDQTLGDLGYRGPEAVAVMVETLFGAPAAHLDILDVGCGTGLCAPGMRPYARRLEGVDLSTAMLAKAAQRSLYDRLFTAEATAFLESAPRVYDLVVAADVLIYFGALEPLFAAAAKSLPANGVLVATAERAECNEGTDGFLLNPHGRYSHSEEYARRALAGAGFSVAAVADTVLRSEAGKPVPGFVLAARRAAEEV